MSKTIEEKVMDLINKQIYVGIDDKVEITSADTIDMQSGEAIKGGLFDEEAFGTSWRAKCHDYHGEKDWVPYLTKEDALDFCCDGYIRLALPVKWRDATNRSNKGNPLCMDVIGVLPPVLRPIVKGEDGKYICHPMNDVYARLIDINNRIRTLLDANASSDLVEKERKNLIDIVHKIFDLNDSMTTNVYDQHSVISAHLIFQTIRINNVCNSIEDIRREVTNRLDEHDALLAEGKNEEARRMVIAAHSIMYKAHMKGVDITDLKDELIRATTGIFALNEILGIELDAEE